MNSKRSYSVVLSLKNYHCQTIKVIGYKLKKSDDNITYLDNPIVIDKYSGSSTPFETTIIKEPKQLYFKVSGSPTDTIYSSKINNWKRPSTN